MEINSALPEESAMHQLRFPPFPQVPDGVELIPFHLFRPSGIRVPIDDEDDVDVDDGQRAPAEMIERDGLGILTIALRVKHATDNMEKRKKRKRKNGAQQMQVAEKPKTWWEIWEEIEEIQRNAYDGRVHPPIARCAPSPCPERRGIGIWLLLIASIMRASTSKVDVRGQRLRRVYSMCGTLYAISTFTG